jgi:hypothetical protein
MFILFSIVIERKRRYMFLKHVPNIYLSYTFSSHPIKINILQIESQKNKKVFLWVELFGG